MLEIEMKFRVADAQAYERLLSDKFGVVFDAPEIESDVFFVNTALGFPNEGKALRIRRRGDYLAATFKGPKLDDRTKTREEIELPLGAVDASDVERAREDWTLFFKRLGFEPNVTVEKTRRRARAVFDGREFEITLDALAGIGTFTELETVAPQEDFEAARASVVAFADAIGLRESLTKSYLALVLESQTGETIEEK